MTLPKIINKEFVFVVGLTAKLQTNGMPKRLSFPADCPLKVQQFVNDNNIAHYVYTVIAQPIAKNAPSFCLTLFGTDNHFDYNDVLNR